MATRWRTAWTLGELVACACLATLSLVGGCVSTLAGLGPSFGLVLGGTVVPLGLWLLACLGAWVIELWRPPFPPCARGRCRGRRSEFVFREGGPAFFELLCRCGDVYAWLEPGRRLGRIEDGTIRPYMARGAGIAFGLGSEWVADTGGTADR